MKNSSQSIGDTNPLRLLPPVHRLLIAPAVALLKGRVPIALLADVARHGQDDASELPTDSIGQSGLQTQLKR